MRKNTTRASSILLVLLLLFGSLPLSALSATAKTLETITAGGSERKSIRKMCSREHKREKLDKKGQADIMVVRVLPKR